jgi:hypothetical protein
MTPALDHVVHSLKDRTEIDAMDSMTSRQFNFDFEHFEMLHSDTSHAVAGLDQARLIKESQSIAVKMTSDSGCM